MTMRTRNHRGILLFAVLFIFAAPTAGNAEGLFRLYLEGQLNAFYSDNVPFRTINKEGDFGTTMVGGFFLDYTSSARYTSLHYDTFAQLFAHQPRYDRAGEGQFVNLTDYENLSPTTKLKFDELYFRDATAVVEVTTSDQSPQFNTSLALLLLANDQSSANWFTASLYHDWGRNWTSEVSIRQTTLFQTPINNSNNSSTSYYQGFTASSDYHFTSRFTLGVGYRFYDFMFSRPGVPNETAHWPFVHGTYQLRENIYLTGMVGVVISHVQDGTNEYRVNPGGQGGLEYRFYHGHASVYGGSEPSLTSIGTPGTLAGVSGSIFYNFTPRLTGNAGGGFYRETGSGLDDQFVSWGVGVNERVNKWLSLNARFIQLRRTENASSAFLPNGVQSGQSAVGDYIVVGMAVSFEAFRWSWQ